MPPPRHQDRGSDPNDPGLIFTDLLARRDRGEHIPAPALDEGAPVSVDVLHAVICSARDHIKGVIDRLDTDLETVSSTRALLEVEATIPPRIKRLLDWLIDDAIRHGD